MPDFSGTPDGRVIRLLDYKDFYDRHWKLVWTLVIVVPIAVLAVGCLAWPEVFWDGYVYRHLWGPTVADAKDVPQGDVTEGYTAVSTITYAIVLAVAVLGIWRAFRYLGIRLDAAFVITIVPWVILGSELRALEDAGLFSQDGRIIYLFISPFIYILIGLLVFGLVILSWCIERRAAERGWAEGFRWGGILLVLLAVPSLVVRTVAPDEMEATTALSPLLVAAACGVVALYLWMVRARRVRMTDLVFLQGAVMAAASLWYVVKWTSGDNWAEADRDLEPWELLIVPAIALLCTGASAALWWAVSRRRPEFRAFLLPVALLLFTGHFLDGAATYRGLDFHGYGEKHVVPGLLIDATGTAMVMLPLKFLVVTAVVYLLDVAYREELEETPTLGWLVKVAVLVLGLAPGMRDMLRIAMGV
jgi:uncharacterized membrane protein